MGGFKLTAIPVATTAAAESTVAAVQQALVNHALGRGAMAPAATARIRVESGSAERHRGFGLWEARSGCSCRYEREPERDSLQADEAAGWEAQLRWVGSPLAELARPAAVLPRKFRLPVSACKLPSLATHPAHHEGQK